MHAKPEKVRPRRLRRRLKAIASIAVALCAGAFLACQKSVTSTADEAGPATDGATPRDVGTDLGDADANPDAEAGRGDAASLTVVDAAPDASRALVPAPPKRDAATVDRKEHRKGMPVPDNLLE